MSQGDSSSSILALYQTAVESYEHLESILHGNEPLHYPTIICEFNYCFNKLNDILAIEDIENIYSMALFQLKHQLTLLLEIIQKPKNNIQCTISNDTIFSAPGIKIARIPAAAQRSHDAEKNINNDKIMEIVKSTIEIPRVKGLDEIAGLIDTKKLLKSLIILPKKQPQLFYNRKVCNSILFYGPPGTGKTHLVHAIAAEANASFHSISVSDILSAYVGETEKTIQKLFQFIKSKDDFVVLFIDEIDGICRKRNGSEPEHSRRTKTELMSQLSKVEDDRNIFIVCATNCPWDLDTAILRRFQKRIYIPLPTRSERFELLQLLMRGIPIQCSADYWMMLLDRTDGYSGSDISDLVKNALNVPILELESTVIWKMNDEGFYEPVSGSQDFNNIICCNLSELPPNSVKSRPVHIMDLINAVESTPATVSQEEVKRYEEFVKN